MTRDDIVRAARSWVGVKWRHQGRNEHGLDCVGLVVKVCQELELSTYDSLAYGRDPDAAKFLFHFSDGGGTRIDIKNAMDGDILIFHQSGYPCHVGILASRRGVQTVIHAHASRKKVVEEDLRGEAPLVAAFRLPGVPD